MPSKSDTGSSMFHTLWHQLKDDFFWQMFHVETVRLLSLQVALGLLAQTYLLEASK
jgi:hypothetical protein